MSESNIHTESSEIKGAKPNGSRPLDNANGEPSPFAGIKPTTFEPIEERPNVFSDLQQQIIDLDDDEDVAEELLTVVPVRRPSKKDFIRAHPKHRFVAMVYEVPDTNEVYFIDRRLHDVLTEDDGAKRVVLALCMTRRKTLFFWPVTTAQNGRWHSSAMDVLKIGEAKWVKPIADRDISAYRLKIAVADYGEPDWGEYTINHLLELAFKGHVIDHKDHKVLRDATGE